MSVQNSARNQQCTVICAISAVDKKICLFSVTARFFCGHCIGTMYKIKKLHHFNYFILELN
jgi:hypothetical protein